MAGPKPLLVLLACLVFAAPAAGGFPDEFAGRPGFPLQDAPAGREQPRLRLRVSAEQANIRESPDIGSAMLRQIPQGTELEAERREGEWFLVRYVLEDGGVRSGWIHESLVTVVSAPAGAPVREPARPRAAPPPVRATPPAERSVSVKRPPAARPAGPRFALAVSSGGTYLAGGDLNAGTRGLAEYYGALTGATPAASAGTVHLTYLLGMEASLALRPGLWAGLGFDYFRGANDSVLEFARGTTPDIVRTGPRLSALPIKATVTFYPWPFLYAKGALAWYFMKCGYDFRYEKGESFVEWKGDTSKSGLGAELAAGGEWEFYPGTFLFAEGAARYAKFSGFEGRNVTTNSNGESAVEEGTLWAFHVRTAPGASYPVVFVRAARPSEARAEDPRPASVNFSGASLRIGVRLKF